MNFDTITSYKCTNCNKVWATKPEFCTCKSKYSEGRRIGPFLIKEEKNGNGEVLVICLLCNQSKLIYYSNLSKQKSCGCKPRHIDILTFTDNQVRYQCRKCQAVRAVNLPVFQYCCEEE